MLHSHPTSATTVLNPARRLPLAWAVVAGVTLTILATTLGAWIRLPLPFTPVPITLQSLAVLLGAAFLGGSWGGLSQALYLALGSFGLPLFAGVAALSPYLLGPTGGYLIGFIAAALFVGAAVKRSSTYSTWQLTGIFAVAKLLILIPGTVQLSLWLQADLKTSLMLGFVPFLPGAVIKVALATAIYKPLQSKARRLYS